jgi:hypothetical protein
MTRHILDNTRYPRLPAHLLANARVLNDRTAILPLLPKGACIVEVGVGLGDFSRQFLDVCEPARFLAIDLFDLHRLDALWGRPTTEIFGQDTHETTYRKRFAAEIGAGRMETVAAESAAAIAALPDRSVDVFYLDADHTYEAVRRDLAAALPKLRDNGWLVLNDYAPSSIGYPEMPYGVIEACHEFMVEHDWEMTHLALAWAMYCDVVLRKRSRGP